jgi:hypothetical protein
MFKCAQPGHSADANNVDTQLILDMAASTVGDKPHAQVPNRRNDSASAPPVIVLTTRIGKKSSKKKQDVLYEPDITVDTNEGL